MPREPTRPKQAVIPFASHQYSFGDYLESGPVSKQVFPITSHLFLKPTEGMDQSTIE